MQESPQFSTKPFNLYGKKRLAFAEQIRKRDRNQRISQIRADLNIRQSIEHILQHTPIDIHKLYKLLHESKAYEECFASVMSQWLTKESPTLQITSKIQCLHWGFVLATIVEYESDAVQLVIHKYFSTIVQFSVQGIDMEVVFVIICALMQNKQSKRKQQSSPFAIMIKQSVGKVLSTLTPIYPSLKITYNQLKFYNKCLKHCPQTMLNHIARCYLFPRFCKFLQTNMLSAVAECNQLIKMLVFVTYLDEPRPIRTQVKKEIQSNGQIGMSADNQQDHTFTSCMLDHNLLEHLKFIIDFILKSQNQLYLNNTFTLINNIIENGYVFEVIHCGLMGAIKSIIHDQEQIPRSIIINACVCFLIIVQSAPNDDNIMEYFKNMQAIESILHILHRYSEYSPEVRKNCLHAIDNLIHIGEQQRIKNSSDCNAYLLKLEYENFEQTFAHFDDFIEMIQKYKTGLMTENITSPAFS